MCGRFVLAVPAEELAALFALDAVPEAFPPRYNIAPTQPILVIREESGVREGVLMRWGLLPGWVKDPAKFTLLINARIETAAEKPAFRAAVKRRRCLVPASGFYEWAASAGPKAPKTPYFLKPAGNAPVAFAGLFETWSGGDGSEIDTAAILTTAASKDIASIHHRMPVAVPPDRIDEWLGAPEAEASALLASLAAQPAGIYRAVPVSRAVNRVANDAPSLIEPNAPEPDVPETDVPQEGGSRPKQEPHSRPKAGSKSADATDQFDLF